jgi:hypothetical protein
MVEENRIIVLEPFQRIQFKVLMTKFIICAFDAEPPVQHVKEHTLFEVLIDIKKFLNVRVVKQLKHPWDQMLFFHNLSHIHEQQKLLMFSKVNVCSERVRMRAYQV